MSNNSVDLLLINPPTLVIKKPDYITSGTLFHYAIENINPGLLSIASYLVEKGISIKIIDLSIAKNFSELEDYLTNHTPKVIGVSSTCCYDYLESIKCLEIAKRLSPESFLIAGGQHGGTLGRLFFEDCQYLDLLTIYEGEKVTEQILEILNGKGSFYDLKGIIYNDKQNHSLHENYEMPELIDLNDMPLPHFELYPNYSYFTPFVEESRGCPNKCYYCVNSLYNDRPYRYKLADKFIRDLDHTISFFGTEPFYAVLSANFGVNPTNTSKMLDQLKERKIHWGTGFGVANPWEEYIDKLKGAGLRMLCVGLESASEEILLRMKKTKDPSKYIDRASQLIKKASELGLNPAVNIMCYIGENESTLKETLTFLLNMENYIHRVDAYSTFEFKGTEVTEHFDSYEKKFGCSRIESEYAKDTHVYPLNISSDINYSMSQNYCEMLKLLFTNEKVAQLKKDSYEYKKLNSLLSNDSND